MLQTWRQVAREKLTRSETLFWRDEQRESGFFASIQQGRDDCNMNVLYQAQDTVRTENI